MSLKLANLIGILVVGLHQGQRTYAPRHQAGHMTAADQTVQREKSACHEAVHICLIGADAGQLTALFSLIRACNRGGASRTRKESFSGCSPVHAKNRGSAIAAAPSRNMMRSDSASLFTL